MTRLNKAHTATANRIARRYGGYVSEDGGGPDVQTSSMTIEVVTAACLHWGIELLRNQPGACYLAVTNQEAVAEAIRLTEGTGIGVMDARGNIVRGSDVQPCRVAPLTD